MPRLPAPVRHVLLCLSLICSVAFAPAHARADDVADEAEVQFTLGTQRYQAGDYADALAHFLASNRLARNRNVLFNIARCYEQLQQFPEAHRHYTRALEGETRSDDLAKIRQALARVSPRVALLKVVSEPAGARVYLDRKDLGERGTTPQTMALGAQSYRVIVALEGYEDAESAPVAATVGVERVVTLRLKRIVGTLRVSALSGASVRLDADNALEACRAPCAVEAAPGQHTIIVAQAGYRTARIPVSVEANRVSNLQVDLAAETGSLVVNTDERGATIEVDGVARGFSPAIVALPVGLHRIRVSLRGFRSVERELRIAAEEQSALELTLTSSESVEAASRNLEAVEEAPASVSLVTDPELRAMRYPTLVEALRGLRGVYVSDDRGYPALGFRGLGRPGSYGNRVLVTLDGVALNDDWIWSSYVSYDLRTDLEDIERIEVVRGPGSVLYGGSAFSGVVNLVTRWKDVPTGRELGVSVAGDGMARARARVTERWGPRAGFWTSLAAGHSQGRDFFVPEYVVDGPPEVAGFSRGLDSARVATLTGRLWWKDFSLAWSANYHDKHLPVGQFETLYGDGRTHQVDTRALVEARLEPKLGSGVSSLSRVNANLYRYSGYFAVTPEEGGVDINRYNSFWLGAEQRFVFSPGPAFSASIGGELQFHPRAHQYSRTEVDGTYFDDARDFSVAAGYASIDLRPISELKLSAGVRLDYYSTFGTSFNPRLALIAQPYAGGTLKLIAGKAFKAPSLYELYYTAVGQLSNPAVQPENIYSLELEFSHRLSSTVVATLAGYANYVTDLISLADLPPEPDGVENIHFQNTDTPVGTLGAELEVRRDWKEGWMLSASYSLQRSAYLASNHLGDLIGLKRSPDFREVPNAPEQLASFKGAVPLRSRALVLMSRLSFEGPRYDTSDTAGADPAQTRTESAVLWDLVLSGTESSFGLNYSLGVYNAFDSRAAYPLSTEFRQRTLPITGRSLLAAVSLTF